MYDTLDHFDYSCPPRLIAQHPLPERDASRLLVLDRETGALEDRTIRTFPEYLRSGDTLVINTTRVMRARLRATRTNGREAEVLLIRPVEGTDRSWIAMVHPGGKLKTGRTVRFGDVEAVIDEVLGGGLRRITLDSSGSWSDIVDRFGSLPLPPYIARATEPDDDTRYQTVFARETGSVAAPTAGLHFTPALLDRIRGRGVAVVDVVLHVGPGTFKPVQTDTLAEHRMHAEWYMVPPVTAAAINTRRAGGGRVWATGTTVTRVLETATQNGALQPGPGWTDLFIRPPYRFRAVDGLLTNFHQPRSTLLMLVCALGGYTQVLDAYRHAVANRYRLFSYGDAMLIR